MKEPSEDGSHLAIGSRPPAARSELAK